jgi:hypothetical protein
MEVFDLRRCPSEGNRPYTLVFIDTRGSRLEAFAFATRGKFELLFGHTFAFRPTVRPGRRKQGQGPRRRFGERLGFECD